MWGCVIHLWRHGVQAKGYFWCKRIAPAGWVGAKLPYRNSASAVPELHWELAALTHCARLTPNLGTKQSKAAVWGRGITFCSVTHCANNGFVLSLFVCARISLESSHATRIAPRGPRGMEATKWPKTCGRDFFHTYEPFISELSLQWVSLPWLCRRGDSPWLKALHLVSIGIVCNRPWDISQSESMLIQHLCLCCKCKTLAFGSTRGTQCCICKSRALGRELGREFLVLYCSIAATARKSNGSSLQGFASERAPVTLILLTLSLPSLL